ncbi:ATP-binding cassette domain-containing protein [Rhizobium sp. LC145]|uniref:thiamine ABC transporter ATP-binding protein n=1 Tax=Rhizobium sp. LC145 TaxID=1120688 RepID=UPI000629E731|nr:ATP-binding cassette domain-containing protein [Rhizobium sp. LC145]KKX27695.1 thiamine ABC transporter ATP-binding protein [Rhizobium sp. LC145]TKT56358.1 ATP-binding cassette domain-containing protein [Rhizobiaceae bacterium LC148]
MIVVEEEGGIVLDKVELRLGSNNFRFDCRLPAGVIIAVTGPSGSGKSTFLNLVAGFETPDAGQVRIAGENVTERHPSERPVSIIFQDNNLFGHLDLFTNVGLGINPSLKLGATDRQTISDALQRVGLGDYERRMPGMLSGGERQRAAFARTLVRQKPVLLMDEPFAALDPGLRLSMANLLLELHQEAGNTILIVTHDPDELRRLADHAIFIDNGKILLEAPIEEFLTRTDVQALSDFLTA